MSGCCGVLEGGEPVGRASREGRRRAGQVGGRELALDDAWRSRVTYQDPAGGTRSVWHRPDLGTHVAGQAVAIEVELHRKSRARLHGILGMWANRTRGVPQTMGSVVYVAGNQDVANLLRSIAEAVGLTDDVFEVVPLQTVIHQTRSHHGRNAN